jgi:hypothetical protein
MQLPKYNKKIQDRKRKRIKICQEPGCGKEYVGHVISKYCELHSNIKNRKRKRRIFEDVGIKNQVYKHKFSEVTNIVFTCQLKGCNRPFSVKVYPKQYIYSKFCEEHRSEYKRINFMRSKS